MRRLTLATAGTVSSSFSAVAASLLQRYGAQDVIHVVDGGVPLWKRQGWPIEQPENGEG